MVPPWRKVEILGPRELAQSPGVAMVPSACPAFPPPRKANRDFPPASPVFFSSQEFPPCPWIETRNGVGPANPKGPHRRPPPNRQARNPSQRPRAENHRKRPSRCAPAPVLLCGPPPPFPAPGRLGASNAFIPPDRGIWTKVFASPPCGPPPPPPPRPLPLFSPATPGGGKNPCRPHCRAGPRRTFPPCLRKTRLGEKSPTPWGWFLFLTLSIRRRPCCACSFYYSACPNGRRVFSLQRPPERRRFRGFGRARPRWPRPPPGIAFFPQTPFFFFFPSLGPRKKKQTPGAHLAKTATRPPPSAKTPPPRVPCIDIRVSPLGPLGAARPPPPHPRVSSLDREEIRPTNGRCPPTNFLKPPVEDPSACPISRARNSSPPLRQCSAYLNKTNFCGLGRTFTPALRHVGGATSPKHLSPPPPPLNPV